MYPIHVPSFFLFFCYFFCDFCTNFACYRFCAQRNVEEKPTRRSCITPRGALHLHGFACLPTLRLGGGWDVGGCLVGFRGSSVVLCVSLVCLVGFGGSSVGDGRGMVAVTGRTATILQPSIFNAKAMVAKGWLQLSFERRRRREKVRFGLHCEDCNHTINPH